MNYKGVDCHSLSKWVCSQFATGHNKWNVTYHHSRETGFYYNCGSMSVSLLRKTFAANCYILESGLPRRTPPRNAEAFGLLQLESGMLTRTQMGTHEAVGVTYWLETIINARASHSSSNIFWISGCSELDSDSLINHDSKVDSRFRIVPKVKEKSKGKYPCSLTSLSCAWELPTGGIHLAETSGGQKL